jgi:hypothetical protein
VQVHCDEGVANHIGPEPCADIREDVGEASAGERAGQPLSRDRKVVPGAGSAPGCAVMSVATAFSQPLAAIQRPR